MKHPVLAFRRTSAPRRLASLVLLTLPVLAFAQEDPDLSRLLFEVAEPPAASVSDTESAPPDATSDPLPQDDDAAILASIAEYEESVAELELTYGPFTQELSEQLQGLATLYEKVGNHQAAIATYEQAVHILRVNNGLFTLEQTPLVHGIIRNYQALNDYREADNRQEYLYYLKQKNYDEGDPALIQAMFDWADWNVQAYYRELDEQSNSRFTITQSAGPLSNDLIPVVGPNNTIYYVPRQPGFYSGSALHNSYFQPGGGMSVQYMLDPRLRRARDLYEEIAEQVEDGAAAGDAPLPETGRKLANISYIVKQEMDYLASRLSSSSLQYGRTFRPQQNPEVSRGYVKGRDTLELLLEEKREDPAASPEEIALALIDLGDWQLAFDRPQAAYENYREAHAELSKTGMSEAEIEAVFAPRPAVEIPVYATHRHSRATLGIPPGTDVDYRGWIDVRLDVDRYGNPRRPRVEAMSPGTHGDVREALLDHLETAKLRPRLAAGEAVEQEDIVLRYHYSY